MKVFLLHRDQDFDITPAMRDAVFEAMLSANRFALTRVRREEADKGSTAGTDPASPEEVLAQDLELGTLWAAMARGDEFVYETAKRVVLSSLRDPQAILYRQGVLADCLAHPETVRALYALATEALGNQRKAGGGLLRTSSPSTVLHWAVRVLTLHVGNLKQLRQIADEQAHTFDSEGFRRFFAMLGEELSDDYLAMVDKHLRELEFKRGLLESAALGKGDKGRNYVVRWLREQRWTERLSFGNRVPSYSFSIPQRDQGGFQALDEIRGRGLNQVANAVAQAADHVQSFFVMLRLELAFYLGCLNLHELLEAKSEPTCFPEPVTATKPVLSAGDLYDVCLTLHLENPAVGNDVDADGKTLVMITGANQGGKSTLLRSLGLAHLMMQCGMFAGARSFRAAVRTGVFTHYKREEDATMTGGKLDEELARMSQIADRITPGAMLLCNESFASTNEREGSEIARQVIRAMLDKQITVLFVTHLYDLAHGFYSEQLDTALFLRAERGSDGRRSFKLRAGEPLPTSYGEDSYRRIFGTDTATRMAAGEIR
jgi:hypothetical protein